MDQRPHFDATRDTFAGGDEVLGRRAAPQGTLRRALRRCLHFLSYHFVLARRRVQHTEAAGFRLTVRPTVFHPRYFLSSESFARFLGGVDLHGKRVADIGTGSGIIALAAARAGAASVLATDINPNAALCAAENARANGFGDRVTGLCCDLLAAVDPRPHFDVILSSPPKHAGAARDLADVGWHAGPNYSGIAALFEQCRERLAPDGRVYVMVSSDSDLALLGTLIQRAGFRARVAHEQSILIESFILFELRLGAEAERASLGADVAA